MSKGQNGLAVQSFSNHPSERELILPRGSMFRVDKITKVKDYGDVYIHDMTLL